MLKKKPSIPFIIVLINYLLYISLGLPDAIMGSAWPSLRLDFGLELATLGYFTLVSIVFSFLSTLVYPRLARKITADQFMLWSMVSVLIGLACLTWGNSTLFLLLSCAFLGLGQGAIDIAVNNFAAKHFSSSLMSILHGCYGIGITLSSLIVALALKTSFAWRGGVIVIGLLQFIILAIFFWQRAFFKEKDSVPEEAGGKLKITPLDLLMIGFYFLYAVEIVIGKYLSSYLVEYFEMAASSAATIATVYWAGLMVGRFVTGITTRILRDKQVILLHILLTCGAVFLLYIQQEAMYGIASFLLGFGLSALYPLMMMMPYKFYQGEKATRSVSFNVAGCQFGGVVLPIVFGIWYERLGLQWFPVSLLVCGGLLLVTASLILRNKTVSDA